MQDGSCDKLLPSSLLEVPLEDPGFPELSAFLSQEEMDRSLDLAREAFSHPGEEEVWTVSAPPSLPRVQPAEDEPIPQPGCEKAAPVYKQDGPRLHGDPRPAEFCSRAASFIQELSNIFRSSGRVGHRGDQDSSSPDSGYLSPKGPVEAQATPLPDMVAEPEAPPRFTQKLKSQEVSEGSPIQLQCRVTGNPQPVVRWFCEGRELHHCPDIQICRDADLHTLVITEAFEDDTGRYTCVASNCLGTDNTSAELYIEGASSSDSECEGSTSKPRAMTQIQKKSTSVSLTIHSSSPMVSEVHSHKSSLIQSLSAPQLQVQSPVCPVLTDKEEVKAPPAFTKLLQDTQAQEGQVVVLECRVGGSPPLNVQWYREGQQIHDSPDFRILQKKPRSAAETEEICTLVIAETFPEDGGSFSCTASNQYGSSSCTAQLSICPVREDICPNGIPADGMCFEDFPPPPAEILQLDVLPQNLSVNQVEVWPSISSLQPVQQISRSTVGDYTNGVSAESPILQNTHTPSAANERPLTPSPVKEDLPLPTKPKPRLNAEQIKQLQEQILLERQEAELQLEQQHKPQAPPLCWKTPPLGQEAPPSPPLPPPPSYQELESSEEAPLPAPAATMQTTTTFSYARPKQFIAAQTPQSSGSSPSSPLSPPTTQRSAPPSFQEPLPSACCLESPDSPSFPPPPPPFLAASLPSPMQDFPPPPPPPLPPLPSGPQSSARFLVSVLPAQAPPTPVNSLGLPRGNGLSGFSHKSVRTPRVVSDSEIQGSKDAVIQDLERKLRFKEDRVSNGQQRLTYEEKMARRLLGADSSTVLNVQQPEEEPTTQEYKVSSFEQRLISEIEFRLERSPVEESDDDVQHDEEGAAQQVAPIFEKKLKHCKVFEGMPVTFTCKVIGDPKPKVYWFKDGKQISKQSEHYRISREPDGTCLLHTEAAALDDDGNYTIMAANPEGRVSSTGRMMIQAVNQRGRSHRTTPGHMRRPRSRSRDSGEENENIQERHFRPHFLQAPGDLIVQEGKLCRMDCKVSGLPTPDLIWQLDGQTIRPDSAHKMLVRENGVHSLIIEPVTAQDAGIYTCIASNRAGQNSFNLELIVAAREMHKTPVFVEKLQNTSVAEGHPVRLECRVSGVPHPQIFWKKENESLTHNTDRLSMHQDNHGYICMIIQPACREDAGWYTVSAKNEAGIVSSTARLDVHSQWPQQSHTPKPRKVRPSASRYAALTERGLDIKAAFFPESGPQHTHTGLVESDDL